MKIRHLRGLGPKTEKELFAIGIRDAQQLMALDPFLVYKQLKAANPSTSLNFLYALIGARDDVPWQQVKRDRKTEILLRLDDLGIAPA